MDIRAYLPQDWQKHPDVGTKMGLAVPTILGNVVQDRDKKAYIHIYLDSVDDEVYDFLFVKFTAVGYFPAFPQRRRGVYEKGSASAEVEITISGEHTRYRLFAEAKSLQALTQLINLIKCGQILPKFDWDAEQIPCPPSEFEKLEQRVTALECHEVFGGLVPLPQPS